MTAPLFFLHSAGKRQERRRGWCISGVCVCWCVVYAARDSIIAVYARTLASPPSLIQRVAPAPWAESLNELEINSKPRIEGRALGVALASSSSQNQIVYPTSIYRRGATVCQPLRGGGLSDVTIRNPNFTYPFKSSERSRTGVRSIEALVPRSLARHFENATVTYPVLPNGHIPFCDDRSDGLAVRFEPIHDDCKCNGRAACFVASTRPVTPGWESSLTFAYRLKVSHRWERLEECVDPLVPAASKPLIGGGRDKLL
jgi:hypothetical protein